MDHNEIIQKFKQIGLVNDQGKPISFTAFKKLGDLHNYSSGRTTVARILFFGHAKENCFGFYLHMTTKAEYLRESYNIFIDTVNGDMGWLIEDRLGLWGLVWGNSGIPISYHKIYYKKPYTHSSLD